ncbi:hypothetical protein AXF42_Ash016925 [Apostasia shenzhenica]|uniref:Uncharacterized protein n=1 Tax=Apostasia shenzhenica TaxID=1088818 RepID=A0A2H9ZRI7_9ASPA|nr:hypothetical protein AXF42_Ash016925 [Apostasia shenzhenica]
MAFGRALAHRFHNITKACLTPIRSGGSRSSELRRFVPDSSNPVLQRRSIVQTALPQDRISLPIWWIDGERVRREVLVHPPLQRSEEQEEAVSQGRTRMTVQEVRKVLKASQIETIRSRLRAIGSSSISLSEFTRVCCEASSDEQGAELARSLDESGAVIVLGTVVYLRPDQELKEGFQCLKSVATGGETSDLNYDHGPTTFTIIPSRLN